MILFSTFLYASIKLQITIETLNPEKWNKNVFGGWQYDAGIILENISNHQ